MKKSTRRIVGLAIGTLVLFGALVLAGCSSKAPSASSSSSTGTQSTPQQTPQREAQTVAQGGALKIEMKDLSDKAQFYPVNVDGTAMEVLACQVCYSSGKGYYIQEGDNLVCQNCGNKFGVDQVEIKTGGCNPLPIFEDEKTTTSSEITVPYETLKKSETFFANWKN